MPTKNHPVSLIVTFARFSILEALNNRLTWIVVASIFVGFALAGLSGDIAVTEHESFQIAFLAAGYRLCAVLILSIFTISTIVREFNDKCIELYLSLPITRGTYFLGKFVGFIFCALLVTAIYTASLLFVMSPSINLLLWGVSLWLELCVVCTISLFCVISFNNQITASLFMAMFLYFLCRASNAIILISESSIIIPSPSNEIIQTTVHYLFLVIPRLADFAQTQWLLYDVTPILHWNLLQTVLSCTLIAGCAYFDLRRKNI